MKFEIRNRFTGNVQFVADIDCADDAVKSVKIGLAVVWACRTGADLKGADLGGADLGGADLIHAGTRSDGYEFFAHIRDDTLWIKAGRRYFPAAKARKHWRETRGGTSLGGESLALVANAVKLAKIRRLA